jgi:1-acyl-sn-glycerol-3-phosphate acyltransferase
MHNEPKVIFVVAPHTSTFDFFVAIATMLALGLSTSWLIASNHSRWPLGYFMRKLGAIRVHRDSSHNLVSQVVDEFKRNDQMLLALSPEGTRKPVKKWKTGFWYMARDAQVPIQLVGLDYARRQVDMGPLLWTSDEIGKDMQAIQRHFKSIKAKHPDKFCGDHLHDQ